MDHSQHSLPDGHHHHPTPGESMHNHHIMTTPATIIIPSEVAHNHDDVVTQQNIHALHEGHGQQGSMEHMMSMAFHFGYNETILFSPWKTESIPGLVGSMCIIFIMAILYEGLKYYREFLFWKTYNLLEYRPVSVQQKDTLAAEENRTPTVHYVGEVIHKQPPSMFSLMHFYQTILHIVQVTLSFFLMLIFMTYNVWLCISVVLGAAVGYFLFCWKKSVIVDVTEHCH